MEDIVKERMNCGFTKAGKYRQRCQCRICGRFNCGEGSVKQCEHWGIGSDGRYGCPTYPCRECYEGWLDSINM